jgi:hypothetical protein
MVESGKSISENVVDAKELEIVAALILMPFLVHQLKEFQHHCQNTAARYALYQ